VASASSTIVLNAVDIQIHSAAFVQNGKESKGAWHVRCVTFAAWI